MVPEDAVNTGTKPPPAAPMNTWCIARATAKTGLLIWFGLQLEKSWAPTKFHQTFAPRDKFAAVGVIRYFQSL